MELPFGRGRSFGADSNKAVDLILGGWSIGYVMQARTGFPITVSTVGQSQQSPRGTQRPDRLRESEVGERTIQKWFGNGNVYECAQGVDDGRCAYQRPALGTFGNSAIGTERAPAYFNVDASIGKRFAITETQNVQFRAEFFNLPNMTMFNPPSRDLSAPATFGLISAQANNPRNIQLGLKYIF